MKTLRPAIYLNLILIFIIYIVIDNEIPVSPYIVGDISKYELLFNVKAYFLENSYNFTGVYRSFINSLVLGEPLVGYVKEIMVSLGIYHIMSLSGLHIGILYVGLNYSLKFLKNPYLKFLIISSILIFYGVLTGLKVATLRAIIMCIIVLFGKIIHRKSNALNTLSIASIIILIYDFRLAYSISFILSFVMVAGIIIYGQILDEIFIVSMNRDVKSKTFFQYINMSLASFMVSFPLTIHFFNRANLLSLLANILVVFLVPIIFTLGVITIVTGVSIFVPICNVLIDYIINVSIFLDNFSVTVSSENFNMVYVVITYILMYFLCIILLKIIKVRRGKYAREFEKTN